MATGYQTGLDGGGPFAPAFGSMAVIPVSSFAVPSTSQYHMHSTLAPNLTRLSAATVPVKLAARLEPANLVAPTKLAAQPGPPASSVNNFLSPVIQASTVKAQ